MEARYTPDSYQTLNRYTSVITHHSNIRQIPDTHKDTHKTHRIHSRQTSDTHQTYNRQTPDAH